MEKLPEHLKKYIVHQDQSSYTPVEQACWRFILRQLRFFLGQHAHESYLDGLEKTGITTDSIPMIEDISKNLEKFGWRALPVSGFIPPAAFMELQSLGVLPIATAMRTVDHLSYTPAPDIVHEAAGHAPILIQPEFSDYLKKYAEAARKAILSSEDLALYAAIRKLSDIKENPESSVAEIEGAQAELNKVAKSMTHVSEAGELSRMNWWTAEYGLIGDLNTPKIFGAGLLSSIGESRHALSPKVKKIPLTVDCIKQNYDITEPQPQLFVTPDFKHLGKVLEDMTQQMAFRCGGKIGLDKAVRAKSVNTVELDSGLQISGVVANYTLAEKNSEQACYFRCTGPTQISFKGIEIPRHGVKYHSEGYGCIVDSLAQLGKSLDQLNESELLSIGLSPGQAVKLEFSSGIVLSGKLKNDPVKIEGRSLIFTFTNCKVVTKNNKVLFDPGWGDFDLGAGQAVVSVFGGPADRLAFGMGEDFVAQIVPKAKLSKQDLKLHELYSKIRRARSEKWTGEKLSALLVSVESELALEFDHDWLLRVEMLELCFKEKMDTKFSKDLQDKVSDIASALPFSRESILEGVKLAVT